MQLDAQQLFSTKRQQVHALQEGQPFSEVGVRWLEPIAICDVPAFAVVFLMLLSRSDLCVTCFW